MKSKLTFRYADKKDTELILKFIVELAKYEELENEVVATEQLLEEWLFEKKKAEVIFAVSDGKEIGFALFFHNFSTRLYISGQRIAAVYSGFIIADCIGFRHLTKIIQAVILFQLMYWRLCYG